MIVVSPGHTYFLTNACIVVFYRLAVSLDGAIWASSRENLSSGYQRKPAKRLKFHLQQVYI